MTSDLPIREPDEIRRDCARKLRVVKVSSHFQPILGYLLGEDWTTTTAAAVREPGPEGSINPRLRDTLSEAAT